MRETRGFQAQRPVLSVVILCYNQAETITRSIESVVSGGDPRVEILVVDDGSNDASFDVVSDSLEEYPCESQYLVNDRNLGTWAACGRGFRASQGKFVMFLAGDDEILSTSLSKCIDLLARSPIERAAFHFGLLVATEDHLSRVLVPWLGVPVVDSWLIGYQPIGPTGGLAIAKDPTVDWERFWMLGERNLQEDWLLHFRLAQIGYRIQASSPDLYVHNRRPRHVVQGLDDDSARQYFRGMNRGCMLVESRGVFQKMSVKTGVAQDLMTMNAVERQDWEEGFCRVGVLPALSKLELIEVKLWRCVLWTLRVMSQAIISVRAHRLSGDR